MSIYDKYLRGVDYGKLWPSVGGPTILAYNGFLAAGIKQVPAIGLASLIFLSSLITFLVIPKTPEQLASEPKILAETAKAAVAPILAEAQSQVSHAVNDTVQGATEQVQQAADGVSDTVSTALDSADIAALKRLAAAFRGQA